MKLVKSLSCLLLLVLAFTAANSQKIVDSVKVYDYPVREGVIYQYEPKSVYASLNAMPIITVMTNYDSIYHFEDGVISDIKMIDDLYAIFLENSKKEILVYSNLKTISVEKGDKVSRGTWLGVMEKGYDGDMNQVDVLIFQKGKEIPYRKILSYMQRNMSSLPPATYTL